MPDEDGAGIPIEPPTIEAPFNLPDGMAEETAGAESSAPAIQPVDTASLYRLHVRSIYAFIYHRVGNREAAEDLTSEVFLKALSHLDLTRGERSIVAWLYRVARNVVVDYWRGAQGTRVIALDDARASRMPSLPSEAGRHELTSARAAALLALLPENYRTVLSCRLLQGLSVAETARQMGTSEANVKVLQHRALKHAATLREGGTAYER